MAIKKAKAEEIGTRGYACTQQIYTDLLDFCTSDMDTAEFIMRDYPIKAESLDQAAKYIAKKRNLPVKVIKRGERVFLVRDFGATARWARDNGVAPSKPSFEGYKGKADSRPIL